MTWFIGSSTVSLLLLTVALLILFSPPSVAEMIHINGFWRSFNRIANLKVGHGVFVPLPKKQTVFLSPW